MTEILNAYAKGERDFRSVILSGANLSDEILRSADLRYANLSGAYLRSADLRDAILSYTNLRGANLSDADLSYADLSGADLRDAILNDANLSSADLRDAKYLTTIQKYDNLDAAILQAINAHPERLQMRTWHTCKTTHCRAGWAVTIHPQGALLEEMLGTNVAAALIYAASRPHMRVPDFFADNEAARASIQEDAAL